MIFKLTPDLKYMKLSDEVSDREMTKLKKFFKRKAVNFYFDPRYQNGAWDGYDHFITDGYVAVGLWKELRNFLRENGYPQNIEGLDRLFNLKLQREEFDEFVNDALAGTSIRELRWFQPPCAFAILKYRYCMAELATSSGKTLISYLVLAYLKKTGRVDKDNKFLMIVPKTDLIGQTADKFEKTYNNGTIPIKVAKIGGKFNPHTKKAKLAIEEADAIVSTYHSLSNMKPEFFDKIRHVNVDEAHSATNTTIKSILRQCQNLEHRFGLSGTIEIETESADYCRLQEYLGPNVMIVTAKDLIDSDYSPDVHVKAIKLLYDEKNDEAVREYVEILRDREMAIEAGEDVMGSDDFGKQMYALERHILINNEARTEFLVSLICGMRQNTLVLFNDVKGQYGKTIHDRLVERGQHTYYIDGGVKHSDREDYTLAIDKYDDVKLLASFGVFSTGIDSNGIYNIIFVESYKSPILIRQSIGRGMRDASKVFINIIDIVDTFGKYSSKHYLKRRVIYVGQEFKVTEYEYDMSPIYRRISEKPV